jgi:hypothetical protein
VARLTAREGAGDVGVFQMQLTPQRVGHADQITVGGVHHVHAVAAGLGDIDQLAQGIEGELAPTRPAPQVVHAAVDGLQADAALLGRRAKVVGTFRHGSDVAVEGKQSAVGLIDLQHLAVGVFIDHQPGLVAQTPARAQWVAPAGGGSWAASLEKRNWQTIRNPSQCVPSCAGGYTSQA